jgi:hypothetical protein
MIKSLTFIQENQPLMTKKSSVVLLNNFVVKKPTDNYFQFLPREMGTKEYDVGPDDNILETLN